MNIKFIFTLILFLFFFQFNFAQDYYFKHYKVEEGLSNNTVLSSLQDSDGFLWFGTKDGLNRFDGYSFKSYRNRLEDADSLGNNFIQSLHEYDGIIWVGTDKGLYKYNKKLDNFTILNEAINNRITNIINDENNNLWFISGVTLFQYNLNNGKITNFDENNSLTAVSITKTTSGDIWVTSSNKIYKYSNNGFYFEPINLDFEDKNSPFFIITTIYAIDDDTILIGTQDHGILSYDIKNKSVHKLNVTSTDPMFVRQFVKGWNNELWIATESGVYIYDLNTNRTINLRKNFINPYAISDNAIYSITIDNEQGVWIGTYFGGVNYYQRQYSQFKKYFPKNNENSISGGAVREIHKDDKGNIWIGTEDAGINKLLIGSNKFKQYNAGNEPGDLSYYNIHGLLPRNGKLWIGTFEHGLDVMDMETGKVIKHYSMGFKEGDLKSNFIFNFYETEKDSLFVLSSRGVYTYNPVKDNFKPHKGFNVDYHYTSFLEDSNNAFWAGSYRDGLYYYNPKTKESRVFRYDTNEKNKISSNSINSIFEDEDKNIWVTTENGLNVLKNGEKEFKAYTTKDGLPSNVSYSILQDYKKKLWISTSKGLVSFNVADSIIKVYTTANGLLSDQFNYNSAFKDSNGDMYFGNLNGMISFNPQEFEKNNFQPPLFLTNLKVNNNEIDKNSFNSSSVKSISYAKNLNLTYKQSALNFEFASLSYIAPELTEYWYKLEGLNEDWIYLNRENKLFFNELSSGNYIFRIKSLTTNGVYSETEPLHLSISPPIWASKMANLLYFLFSIFLIYFSIRAYHLATKKRNNLKLEQLNIQKEKEIYNAKIEFFTNVAHEIRTPLTLIKSPLENLLKKSYQSPDIPQNLTIMEKNTERLLNLVNELLDFRKTEMEGLQLTFVESNISDLVRNLHLRFSNYIDEKNIEFIFELGDKDIYAFIDEEAMRKTLSNLFNNAIKYAKSKVSITLFRNETEFEVVIKNDGSLIPYNLKTKIFEPFFRIANPENTRGTGIGLSLAHSLTELHKGTLELKDSDDKMNTFILKIPLHQEKEFILYKNESDSINQEIEKRIKHEKDVKDIKPHVLVVEDNIELLNFISEELKRDFKVFKSTNGLEALKVILNETIHIVISDITMPLMDGITLCQKIKNNIESSHIPVILLTAKDAINSKISGLQSGADAYIVKPFSMDYVKVQINNLLSNRKHVMEYFSSSPLSHVKSIAHNRIDEEFIDKLDSLISENITDTNLSVESLAEIMFMSRSTLYRKIKDISNLSPNELINTARLKKAAELLLSNKYKIYEIAEMVGYKSQSSFGRNFHKQFGMSPSEYIGKRKFE